jgi:hypothetical protein
LEVVQMVSVLVAGALNLPSGRVLLALAPLLVLVAGIVIYSLFDLARARSVRYLPKAVWALIVVFVSTPLGALAYLVFGRDRDGQRTNDD